MKKLMNLFDEEHWTDATEYPDGTKQKVLRDNDKKGKTIRLASEPDEFEVLELPGLINEFEDWLLNNPKGTWDQFMSTASRAKLNSGGDVESYAELIDATFVPSVI